jgi:RHS repeat-associated protein
MGEISEQLEYTPYVELWVEHLEKTIETTPFRFTGKERDSETGLYYFVARYLNPQTSMWLSADPSMGEYIPQAPINDEAKKHNKELPGMGGVYNYVNLHTYHCAGNNPVKLTDPDGRYLGLKRRLDKIGEDISRRAASPDSRGLIPYSQAENPFKANEDEYANLRSEIKSGLFKRFASNIANTELNKKSSEIESWVKEKNDRLEALLMIREKNQSDFETIMKSAENEYQKTYDATRFVMRENGTFTLATERQKKEAGDLAANIKLDELIQQRIPSYRREIGEMQ